MNDEFDFRNKAIQVLEIYYPGLSRITNKIVVNYVDGDKENCDIDNLKVSLKDDLPRRSKKLRNNSSIRHSVDNIERTAPLPFLYNLSGPFTANKLLEATGLDVQLFVYTGRVVAFGKHFIANKRLIFEDMVKSVLLMMDVDKDILPETSMRVTDFIESWKYDASNLPKLYFEKGEVNYDEMVVVRGTNFASLCAHHILPIYGTVDIGYIPNETVGVVGVSKFSRIIDYFSHKPSLQEKLTKEIGDFLVSNLGTNDVAVRINATHLCMSIRGVKQPNSRMVTTDMRGVFRENLSTREEFMRQIGCE